MTLLILGKYSSIGRALDCDSKGCRFKSYYLPMNSCYNLIKKINLTNNKEFKINLFNKINNKNNIKILKKIITYKIKKNRELFLISINKPKNQFFLNFFNNKFYNYSTGMIIKSLKLESRSIRRIKPGFFIFFSFFIKKFKQLNEQNNFIFFLKKFNKINIFKNLLLKIFNKKNTTVILKISKNLNKKNYKKISYINKRIRRKFAIE